MASELAVEFRVQAFTAVIDIQAFAALLTESGFMFVADPHRLPVRMMFALHCFFFPTPFFSRFVTGRGLSKT